MDRSVTSLQRLCLECVVTHLDALVTGPRAVPYLVRSELLRMVCMRGRLTDRNAEYLAVDTVRELDLSQSEALSDIGITFIASTCHYLTSLNLSRGGGASRGNDDGDGLTDKAVLELAQNCPNLVTLRMRNRGRLTDASVCAVVQRCRSLRTLDVGGCRQLGNAVLLALSRCSLSLTSLNVSFTEVTKEGFRVLCSDTSVCGLPLEEIHATNCSLLCDSAVQCVARLPSLRILIFHNCPLVTAASRTYLDDIMDRQQQQQRREQRRTTRRRNPRPVQMSWTVY